MPNIESAKKRARQSEKNRTANRAAKTELATLKRKLYEAAAAGDKAAAQKINRTYSAQLDKAAKRGVIKANNASRHKSRAARQIAKLA